MVQSPWTISHSPTGMSARFRSPFSSSTPSKTKGAENDRQYTLSPQRMMSAGYRNRLGDRGEFASMGFCSVGLTGLA
jgi:hypothetical protein